MVESDWISDVVTEARDSAESERQELEAQLAAAASQVRLDTTRLKRVQLVPAEPEFEELLTEQVEPYLSAIDEVTQDLVAFGFRVDSTAMTPMVPRDGDQESIAFREYPYRIFSCEDPNPLISQVTLRVHRQENSNQVTISVLQTVNFVGGTKVFNAQMIPGEADALVEWLQENMKVIVRHDVRKQVLGLPATKSMVPGTLRTTTR